MKSVTKFAIGAASMVAVSAGVAGVTAYFVSQNNQPKESQTFYESFNTMPLTRAVAMDSNSMQPVDLTKAAESSLNSVVHIVATQRSKVQTIQQMPPQSSTNLSPFSAIVPFSVPSNTIVVPADLLYSADIPSSTSLALASFCAKACSGSIIINISSIWYFIFFQAFSC